jgi:small subunit ribosomal protein S8
LPIAKSNYQSITQELSKKVIKFLFKFAIFELRFANYSYMTDTIADLLTRIRNAYAARHTTVDIPHSRMKEAVLHALQAEGFIAGFTKGEESPQPLLHVTLKYVGSQPAVTRLIRVSKPGRRVYVGAKDIDPTLSGYGVSIISTNRGVMTGKTARTQNVGGEIICQVW